MAIDTVVLSTTKGFFCNGIYTTTEILYIPITFLPCKTEAMHSCLIDQFAID